MRDTKRTCVMCGNQYKYCPNCGSDYNKPTWYGVFCSDNCHDIYKIVTDYRDKKINAITAQSKLKDCDVSAVTDDGVKKLIKEILSSKTSNNNSSDQKKGDKN